MAERVLIVVPARFSSRRYPGKPLAPRIIASGEARSLIERSWRAAKAVPQASRILVATDDERIRQAAEAFGAEVAMTPEACANGTERCAAALAASGDEADIIVNLQGDAPLTLPSMVEALVERMKADPDLAVCTPAIACTPSMLSSLLGDEAAGRVGGTTATFAANGDALYFSKRIIPYLAPDNALKNASKVFLHLGVYAYRRSALMEYAESRPSALEELEGLEQLRFLDRGIRVGVVICATPEWDLMELNNPEDLPGIEAALLARGIE
jgi:3-deoxy-manno-octulosonate cytidylyltransferase (CMP-KDO synthetase)